MDIQLFYKTHIRLRKSTVVWYSLILAMSEQHTYGVNVAIPWEAVGASSHSCMLDRLRICQTIPKCMTCEICDLKDSLD